MPSGVCVQVSPLAHVESSVQVLMLARPPPASPKRAPRPLLSIPLDLNEILIKLTYSE